MRLLFMCLKLAITLPAFITAKRHDISGYREKEENKLEIFMLALFILRCWSLHSVCIWWYAHEGREGKRQLSTLHFCRVISRGPCCSFPLHEMRLVIGLLLPCSPVLFTLISAALPLGKWNVMPWEPCLSHKLMLSLFMWIFPPLQLNMQGHGWGFFCSKLEGTWRERYGWSK